MQGFELLEAGDVLHTGIADFGIAETKTGEAGQLANGRQCPVIQAGGTQVELAQVGQRGELL